MASRIKARLRARGASIAAILGAAATLGSACATEDGEAPPIDYDARPDGKLEAGDGPTLIHDGEAPGDGTLVDLDGEADAPLRDASRDHEAGASSGSGGGSSGGGSSGGGSSGGGSSGGGSSGGATSGGGTSGGGSSGASGSGSGGSGSSSGDTNVS